MTVGPKTWICVLEFNIHQNYWFDFIKFFSKSSNRNNIIIMKIIESSGWMMVMEFHDSLYNLWSSFLVFLLFLLLFSPKLFFLRLVQILFFMILLLKDIPLLLFFYFQDFETLQRVKMALPSYKQILIQDPKASSSTRLKDLQLPEMHTSVFFQKLHSNGALNESRWDSYYWRIWT